MTVIPPHPNPKTMTPESRKMIQKLLYMWGFAALIIGAYFLADTSLVEEYLGLDQSVARILAGAVLLIGLTDFFVAHILFKTKDRK